MKTIRCLLVQPNELPLEIEIKNTLKEKQKLVGGLIEVCYLDNEDDVCIVCNETGKIDNLKPNRYLGSTFIYGDFLVVGADYKNVDFKSLTRKQIKYYQNFFGQESINKTNSKIIAHKLALALFRRR